MTNYPVTPERLAFMRVAHEQVWRGESGIDSDVLEAREREIEQSAAYHALFGETPYHAIVHRYWYLLQAPDALREMAYLFIQNDVSDAGFGWMEWSMRRDGVDYFRLDHPVYQRIGIPTDTIIEWIYEGEAFAVGRIKQMIAEGQALTAEDMKAKGVF